MKNTIMDKAAFINVLQEEFEEPADNPLKESTDFRALEDWSSMMALIWLSKLNDHYQITISAEELAKAKTIDDLYQLSLAKVSN